MGGGPLGGPPRPFLRGRLLPPPLLALTVPPPFSRSFFARSDAWDEDATLKDNFSSLGLMRDVNRSLKEKSRSARPGGIAVRRGATVDEVLASEAARAAGPAAAEAEAAEPEAVDPEFVSAAGQGKASRPKPLTERQLKVLEGLMDAHGTDVDAMVLDTKRNAMQHSAGALRGMLKSYAYYQGKTAAGFRAPIKKLIGRY